MRIEIFKVPYHYTICRDVKFLLRHEGYIEMDAFDEQLAWHLCNWSCWSNNKPDNLFSNIDIANTDVVFMNPETKKYYIPLICGWIIRNSLKEVANYYLYEAKTKR